MRAVADHVAYTRQHGAGVVVVVSAMGKSTDNLLKLANDVSTVQPGREMDMLLTTGERVSMSLLCMALAERGVEAISFTGSKSASSRIARMARRRFLRSGVTVSARPSKKGESALSQGSKGSQPIVRSPHSGEAAPTQLRSLSQRHSTLTHVRSIQMSRASSLLTLELFRRRTN